MPTLLSLVAILFLFLKLPGVPEFIGLGNCQGCSTTTPYVPMLAASYFAFLFTATLCFRSFPTKAWKWGGVVWAIGLAITLTYLSHQICWICLIAHTCHIALWITWKPKKKKEQLVRVKLALAFTSALAIMALFSTLNFTFVVYGLQHKSPMGSLVRRGTSVKPFALETITSDDLSGYKGVIFHFVSPNCPYCKDQISRLDEIAKESSENGYRFINISRQLTSELTQLSNHLEWVEDDQLFSLFGVEGFPTLVMVDGSGTVIQAIAGAAPNLEADLASRFQVSD